MDREIDGENGGVQYRNELGGVRIKFQDDHRRYLLRIPLDFTPTEVSGLMNAVLKLDRCLSL